MSNLLQVLRWKVANLDQGQIPLCMEFTVTPESAPFLVSTSKGLLWFDEALPSGLIRAAVREVGAPGSLFLEVVRFIEERSLSQEWGNVLPFTFEGVQAGVEYLEHYGLQDFELLVPVLARFDWLNPEQMGDVRIRVTSWLEPGTAVLVPSDRGFVGCLGHLTPKKVVVAVHNASRGVVILREPSA